MKDFFQSWGLLLLAILLGAIAFFFTNLYLSNKEQSLREAILGSKEQVVQVVVATVDVLPGTELSSANMAIAPVSKEHLSASAVLPETFSQYEGQVLKYPMSRGEPLLTHAVDGKLIERFSDLIDVGDRAVTIEVDSLTSNSGLLSVGDFVDVVVSGDFKSNETGSTKEAYLPLFQKIKVLAIDRNPLLSKEQNFRYDLELRDRANQDNGIDYDTVTLAIESEEANLLAFASEVGDIKFFLRNSGDEGDSAPDSITKDDLSLTASNAQQLLGSYLYMSAGSSNQVVKPLLTLSDAVVNQDLRSTAYQKSVPVSKSRSRQLSQIKASPLITTPNVAPNESGSAESPDMPVNPAAQQEIITENEMSNEGSTSK